MMTGRDLIVYILENGLEDEVVFSDGRFLGFVSEGEVAKKMMVGVATVRVWVDEGILPGVHIGDHIYIPSNFEKLLMEAICNE